MITLELVGPYPPEGWQDEEGTEHFNHEFSTPYGMLGALNIRDGLISRADAVVLVRKSWAGDETVTFRQTALGFRLMCVNARNGNLEYIVLQDDLEWSDRPGQIAPCHLAYRVAGDWDADDQDTAGV